MRDYFAGLMREAGLTVRMDAGAISSDGWRGRSRGAGRGDRLPSRHGAGGRQLRRRRRERDRSWGAHATQSPRTPPSIIAASGMCEAGRILHHLRNAVEDPKNTVLIIGFQAQHTLGRRIAERRPMVKIFGIERPLEAEVVVMDAFSAHADRDDLVNFVDRCRGRLGEGIPGPRRRGSVRGSREAPDRHGHPRGLHPHAGTIRAPLTTRENLAKWRSRSQIDFSGLPT